MTTYHKEYSMEGTIKVIHRFISHEMSELVVYYLWFILSFRWPLETVALGEMDSISPLLWAIDKKRWTNERLYNIFEKESDNILKSTLNIRTYRYVVMTLANKHISPR